MIVVFIVLLNLTHLKGVQQSDGVVVVTDGQRVVVANLPIPEDLLQRQQVLGFQPRHVRLVLTHRLIILRRSRNIQYSLHHNIRHLERDKNHTALESTRSSEESGEKWTKKQQMA